MTDEKEQKRIGTTRPIDDSKSFSPGTCGRGYRNPLILSWSKDVPHGVFFESKTDGREHINSQLSTNPQPRTTVSYPDSCIPHRASSIEMQVFYAKQTQNPKKISQQIPSKNVNLG